MNMYFELGFEHIISLMGFDHLLFIITLCAIYHWRQWKQVLWLLTGFTLGHSLTLALTALHWVHLPARLVETLIPVTILITSVANVALPVPKQVWRPFGMATVFGLIHGCGFAGYFSMMLGEEESVLWPLLGFNLGLEAGQILTALLYFGVYRLLELWRLIQQRDWTLFVSGAGAGLAIKMILEACMGA
jgi:hydrogenase/urease accessory protein HupE